MARSYRFKVGDRVQVAVGPRASRDVKAINGELVTIKELCPFTWAYRLEEYPDQYFTDGCFRAPRNKLDTSARYEIIEAMYNTFCLRRDLKCKDCPLKDCKLCETERDRRLDLHDDTYTYVRCVIELYKEKL